MDDLTRYGWNPNLERVWNDLAYEQFVPGRVIADYGLTYRITTPNELSAEVSGRLEYVSEPHELPKIGDWVALQVLEADHGIVHAVLPRKSEIGRKQPGEKAVKQVLAANVDLAFLVQALDHDFSPERMQRYLFQLIKEGVQPILVLNKADKESDIAAKLKALEQFKASVIISSALQNEGIEQIADAITPGYTAVFLGSSGVGKSTIINALLGEVRQATQDIREADSKGRHTTTHRELFVLRNGGLVIDTPGLRELQLWGSEDELAGVFGDVEALAGQCKFTNCTHISEPDCAVRAGIAAGSLDVSRLEAYFKFQKELRYLNTKVDENAAHERRQTERKMGKYYNQVIKGKNDRKKA